MDHEKRIKVLEKELEQVKEMLKELSPNQQWITLAEATKQYGISKTVILKRIHSGVFTHLKDWKRNGNKFLINVKSLKKIM